MIGLGQWVGVQQPYWEMQPLLWLTFSYAAVLATVALLTKVLSDVALHTAALPTTALHTVGFAYSRAYDRQHFFCTIIIITIVV